MISLAVVAAFLSGFAWSGLDVARKSLARDLKPSIVAAGLTLGVAVLFGAMSAFTKATVQLGSYALPGSLSVLFGGGVQLLIVESVRRSELSRTIPLLSFTPVATTLFGVVVLREIPSFTQWLGILLVFVGGLGLALTRAPNTRGRRLSLDSGSALMLAAALLISAAAPFDKLAVAASSVALHGFFQSAGIGVLLLVFLGIRGNLRGLRRAFVARPALLGSSLLALAALGLQFAAYGGAMVGVVETIKRVVGLAGSLVAGYAVFGEQITPGKLAAVATMAGGVTLMML